MYYGNRAIKTKEARAWEAMVLELLEEHEELLAIAEKWKVTGGVFQIAICNYYPKHIYFNRQGQVSAKTFDITNCEKPLVDLIMNRYMDVDDRFLVFCESRKMAVDGPHQINVTLELI